MKTNYTSLISFLLIIFFIFFSFHSQLPNKISDKNTAKTNFSTERALQYLSKIAQKEHYVGSTEHDKVKYYIEKELTKLGLQVNEQEQIGINTKWRAATKTQNIFASIKGSNPNGKSLVLLAHYDSAPHSSFGASDAGSGVVTILEGIRAFLETNKQPKNNIIILFTDAEEIGLLGADAFVNNNALIGNVGLVLNFEARGSGGPSYMLLETNGGNKNLIQAFNKANPKYPVSNSLMYSIYKMLPNDTDLTVFRQDGNINGFNFAFIGDHFDYHTANDTYDNLDRKTLEHQGSYLTSLLSYFADADLDSLDSDSDNVFFNFPKIGLVNYPFSWTVPMFILATLLFFAITFIGVQRHQLTTKSMFAGFVPFLGSLFFAGIITTFGWKLLKIIHPQYNEILHGFTYNGYMYIFAFSAITIGILFWFYKRYFKKHKAENLIVAPLFIWGIINFFIVIYLKGASFFILPVYLGLVSLAILLFSKKSTSVKVILLTILAVPSILVFVPLVKMFPVGLGLKVLGVSSVFIVLLFGLFIPIFQSYNSAKRGKQLFLLLGFLTLVIASFKSNYTENRKQPTSLVYVLDADKQEAYFASYESKINDFNKAYLTENPTKGSFVKNATASKYATQFKIHKKTTVVPLQMPSITVLRDTIILNNRTIKLQILSNRKANRFELLAKNIIHFVDLKVNSESFRRNKKDAFIFDTKKQKQVLSYFISEPNEFLNIEMTFPAKEHPSFDLYEVSYDLFTNNLLEVKPRTDKKMMPTPFVINDAIIIKKEIAF